MLPRLPLAIVAALLAAATLWALTVDAPAQNGVANCTAAAVQPFCEDCPVRASCATATAATPPPSPPSPPPVAAESPDPLVAAGPPVVVWSTTRVVASERVAGVGWRQARGPIRRLVQFVRGRRAAARARRLGWRLSRTQGVSARLN